MFIYGHNISSSKIIVDSSQHVIVADIPSPGKIRYQRSNEEPEVLGLLDFQLNMYTRGCNACNNVGF